MSITEGYHWTIGSTEGGGFTSIQDAIRHARNHVRTHAKRMTRTEFFGEEITFQVIRGTVAGRGKTLLSWTGSPNDFVKPNWLRLAK